MTEEWQLVRRTLAEAGVGGVKDFSLFVNNTKFFPPSTFDSEAAAPTLLALLPKLEDPRVVATVGRRLIGPWVRRDGAYETLLIAFKRWAVQPGETGWVLGDALVKAADKSRASELVALADDDRYGAARGLVVEALWRYKRVVDVEPVLRRLILDPTVSLMAMSSLQRTIGGEATAPILQEAFDATTDPVVRCAAERQLRRISRKLAKG